MALNAASTKRRLPKWQIAAMLLIAAFIGHGLTLLPMHLHERGHKNAATKPVYYVHGAMDESAFGISLHEDDAVKEFTMKTNAASWITIRLALLPPLDTADRLDISMCQKDSEDRPCNPIYSKTVDLGRIWPSVIGDKTNQGEDIHIFVQEMANASLKNLTSSG